MSMVTFTANEHAFMARAIELARRGLFTTDPNPRVGCVIVKNGAIIGEGYHVRAGEAHAEVNALQDAGDDVAGVTVFLTLEPCSHHGRTPPCCDALIAAGVSRVIVAMQDPNPKVSGQGLAKMRDAGIVVETGLLGEQAEALNPGYLMRMRHGRPWIRCKLAMSLDGRTALASGESKWITSSAAREDVHVLRARSSAIMTGSGTVLHDDPSMTVRLQIRNVTIDKQPLRIVLDSQLQVSTQATILKQPGKTRIVCCQADSQRARALQAAGAEVVELAGKDGHIDLSALMQHLAEDEINEVLLESGATLAGAMLMAGYIDELIVYMAPVLMGDSARGLLHLPGLDTMADKVELNIIDIRALGSDWRITARPVYKVS